MKIFLLALVSLFLVLVAFGDWSDPQDDYVEKDNS